jgi:CDP-diacylglycerol pyrophosphatase
MVDDVFHIHVTVVRNRMQVSKKRRKTTEVKRRNPLPSLPYLSQHTYLNTHLVKKQHTPSGTVDTTSSSNFP